MNRSVSCRDFRHASGSLVCPEMHEFVNFSDEHVPPNVTFRIYSGNSGWLPGLYERRHDSWDQGMRTHLGRDYL